MKYYDNKLPEILGIYSRDGFYFAQIKKIINNVSKIFEFGISLMSYRMLSKIFSFRPFDNLPGLKYRYYFVPSITKNKDNKTCKTEIRCKIGTKEKNFEFDLTLELFSHLLWFFELENFENASYLKEIQYFDKY